MDYLGKAVRYQHRVATGHAKLKSVGSGVRHHIPVPTELQTHDALILLAYPVEGEDEPRVSLLYATGKPMNGADYQNSIAIAHDVPHAEHDDAEGQQFWYEYDAETLPAHTSPEPEGANAGPEEEETDENADGQQDGEPVAGVADQVQGEATEPASNAPEVPGNVVQIDKAEPAKEQAEGDGADDNLSALPPTSNE